MRLIDADFFKSQFKSDTVTGNTIHNMINEQPTAYCVDSIIKRINNMGKKYCDSVKCDKNCDDCEHGCLMYAITNVIKSGGID